MKISFLYRSISALFPKACLIAGFVSLTLFSKANCPNVVASFTTNVTQICGSGFTAITFTNTSTGTGASGADYDWYRNGVQFDNTSGLGNPNNSSVNAVGTYTFMCIVTDHGPFCRDTAIVTVTVFPVPNANFTFNPNNACAGTSVAFTNTSTGTTGATTYNWNFGDGNTSTATSPNHTFAAGGTYTVTLTTTNFAGCSDVQSFNVTAMDIPAVGISGDDGDGNTTNCLFPGDPSTTETVVFTNTTTNAVSYLWNFGDGNTSTSVSPTHIYTSFGTYTVTMTATHANGCTATATLTVVFEKYVAASMTLDITQYSGCAPHTLTTLTNLSVNANSYVWNFGDGTPSVTTTSSTPPLHTYATAGTYTISLAASNSCNTANVTISPIIIVGGPVANFSNSLPGNLGCAPQNVTFGNLSTGVQPANNYTWNMGNGNTYTNVATPPAQSYPTQGTYQVMLVAGSACGLDTAIVNLIIDSIPIADIIVNPLVGCSPLTVNTTNNSSGNNVTWAWYIDGVYTYNTQNIPAQTFTAPPGNATQTHSISLTVSNHCGVRTDAENILVHPAVDARYTVTNDTICAGQSITFTDGSYGDFLNWQWNFGEGTTSTLQGPHTITYPVAGTYTAKLIVNGFCGVDSLLTTIVVNPIPVADIAPVPVSGCNPLTVNFTNNSTPGGTYAWNFGIGAAPATSTLFTPPAITYSTNGISTIILNVNVLGCTMSDTTTVTVFPQPVPSFTLTPNNGCTPLSVAINNTTPVTAGDIYNWNFGNGNTSVAQNPGTQIYIAASNDSIYTVSLSVTTANGCTQSVNSTVTVHPLPVADFTPLPDTVCAITPVAFLNNSIGASAFAWNFGDAGTSAAMSPAHTFLSQGTFTVQLIASTAFGCRDTLTHNVVVDSIPTAAFSFSIECVGDSTVFTDLSTGGITNWGWNFADASPFSNQSNPSHLYAAAGTYNVLLTVTNPAGCTNSVAHLVTVNAVPVANFNASVFCLGQATQFTDATSGVPVNWNWDFGDGNTSALQNPTHTYAAAGVYTVTLISFGGAGCSDTISQNITITGIPTANFAFTNVCTNDTTFFNSTSLGVPDTYVWNFGDGFTDNTNNPDPFHTYTIAGTYNVTLTAGYAASGCTNAITIPVTAFPRTNPAFNSNTPCLGAATNFTDITTGVPNNWNWDFGDGATSIVQNPSHTYANPGIFNITLITSNAFTCTDTLNTTIQVFSLPVADFTNDTICDGFATAFIDLSTSAVQWRWDFGDGSAISTLQNPFHTFPANGTYNVQQIVTNAFGCTDTIVHAVTVNPNPTANYNFTIACFSYPTIFTDASVGAVQWNWNYNDATANDNTQNTTHTFGVDGNYNVELIVTNIFGCRDTLSQSVTVLPQPQAGFTNTTVCAGQTVQFTDTSLGSPTIWNWDFGDGSATTNVQDPIHTFVNGGTFNITLIAGNPAGCLDTTIVPVTVFTVPDANFTSDTVCLFNITHLTDLTTDAAALQSWFWDFSDGNNSFSQNPNYIFQTPGTFNVTLTVTNINGCDTTITLPVIVNDVPVAAFTSDTVCLGGATTFTDLSTGVPTSWTWSFGDGTVVNGSAVETHTYASAGSYIVTLVVSGTGNNCSDMTFGVVTVSTDAVAGATLPDTVCVNEVFNFSDNSTINVGVITQQNWDMGDGTIYTTATGTHTYANAGTFFVTHSVTTSGGCSTSVIDTIVVNPLPIVDFSSGSACSGQSINFTDLSQSNIVSWNWDFGDGNSDTVQNPSHTYASGTNCTVTLIVTNGFGCTSSASHAQTVFSSPTAGFTNNTVCWGTPVSFFDNSTIAANDTIVSYFWDFGDGYFSFLSEDQHAFQVYDDTFAVMHVVTSANGCSDTIIQNVFTLPIVNFDYFPDAVNGCAPMAVQFTDQSTSTGGTTVVGWIWNFDDGSLSFAQNPSHMYPNAGAYYVGVTVTTSDGCVYSDSLNYPVTVFPQPVADFSASPYSASIYTPDITITDLSSGAVGWEYEFGDNTYSNSPSGTHSYTEPGEYTITQMVTNVYGCRDTTTRNIIILEETTFFAPNAITPDGNGLNDVFYVTGSGILKARVMIFNRWGEKLYDSENMAEGWDATFKGEKVKPDVYVWKVQVDYITGIAETYYGHVTVLR